MSTYMSSLNSRNKCMNTYWYRHLLVWTMVNTKHVEKQTNFTSPLKTLFAFCIRVISSLHKSCVLTRWLQFYSSITSGTPFPFLPPRSGQYPSLLELLKQVVTGLLVSTLVRVMLCQMQIISPGFYLGSPHVFWDNIFYTIIHNNLWWLCRNKQTIYLLHMLKPYILSLMQWC